MNDSIGKKLKEPEEAEASTKEVIEKILKVY